MEPATYAMGIRTFKDDTTISPEGAFIKMREAMTNAMKDYHTKHGLPQPQTIVDMGCSTGISTRWMAAQWPDATFTGIDLSPHFLSLAEQAERWVPALCAALGERGDARAGCTRAHVQWQRNGSALETFRTAWQCAHT